MPNWCFNNMSITGTKREMRKFLQDIKTGENEWDINKLVPLNPLANSIITRTVTDSEGNEVESKIEVFATMEKDGFDGYANAMELWGSKWGACDVQVYTTEPNGKYLEIHYESAWEPCDTLIINISKQYPNLIFGISSEEESHAFLRWIVIHDGKVVEYGNLPVDELPDHLEELHNKIESSEATQEDWDNWYDAEGDWYGYLLSECDTDCLKVIDEYKKHIAYLKRCAKKGVVPRTFISSV